jgi:hypothetical protein
MKMFAGQDVSVFLQKPFTSRDIAEKVKVILRGGCQPPRAPIANRRAACQAAPQ